MKGELQQQKERKNVRKIQRKNKRWNQWGHENGLLHTTFNAFIQSAIH